MAKKTKTYLLEVGGHVRGEEVYKEGDKIECTPRQARALVNKIRLLDEPSEPEPENEEDDELTTREDYMNALDELGVDYKFDELLGDLKKLYEGAAKEEN